MVVIWQRAGLCGRRAAQGCSEAWICWQGQIWQRWQRCGTGPQLKLQASKGRRRPLRHVQWAREGRQLVCPCRLGAQGWQPWLSLCTSKRPARGSRGCQAALHRHGLRQCTHSCTLLSAAKIGDPQGSPARQRSDRPAQGLCGTQHKRFLNWCAKELEASPDSDLPAPPLPLDLGDQRRKLQAQPCSIWTRNPRTCSKASIKVQLLLHAWSSCGAATAQQQWSWTELLESWHSLLWHSRPHKAAGLALLLRLHQQYCRGLQHKQCSRRTTPSSCSLQ